MTQPPRTIKSVPFVDDSFEDELLAFAIDPKRGYRGKFAPYIKRLIERDMGGWEPRASEVAAVIPQPGAVVKEPDRRAMVSGFL